MTQIEFPQPDFSKLWREHFCATDKVYYRIRSGPNALHDVAFVSSLIHDARLIPSECKHWEGGFSAIIDRDRWEHRQSSNDELLTCSSQIAFAGVECVSWTPSEIDQNQECWIDYLWLNEDFRSHTANRFRFHLVGDGFRIAIAVNSDDWEAVLKDN